MVRVFANGSGDRDLIPGRIIPKTQKMVLDTYLLNTQHYKVQIKGKYSNPGKGVHLGVVAIEKKVFGLPSTTVDQLTNNIYLYIIYIYIY